MPGFLKILWLTGFRGAAGWSLLLAVASTYRQRIHLVVASLTGAVLAVGLAAIAGAVLLALTMFTRRRHHAG